MKGAARYIEYVKNNDAQNISRIVRFLLKIFVKIESIFFLKLSWNYFLIENLDDFSEKWKRLKHAHYINKYRKIFLCHQTARRWVNPLEIGLENATSRSDSVRGKKIKEKWSSPDGPAGDRLSTSVHFSATHGKIRLTKLSGGCARASCALGRVVPKTTSLACDARTSL